MQIIPYTTQEAWLEARAQDITSTEVSALFDLSPYTTHFELWHRKKDQTYVKIKETDRMLAGKVLEPAIAELVSIKTGWKISPKKEYIREPELKIGSSFDFEIIEPEKAILEIKNVDGMVFKDQWAMEDDGTITPPHHIEMQVQHQMLVSGYTKAYIGALVEGHTVHIIERSLDYTVASAILKKVKAFWRSIDDNKPPEPNFKTDSEFIASMFNFSEPGKVIDIAEDQEITELASLDKNLSQQMKILEEQRKEIKAKILMKLGDAEKAIGNGFTISSGMVGPATVSYEREGYRTFRINWPRAKKEKTNE